MAKRFLISFLLAMNTWAADHWATVWTGSSQGPYPVGNAVAQPDLQAVFPGERAREQTFQLILKPDLWSGTLRLRFSNVFGARPLQLDSIYVGVHATAGRLLPGTIARSALPAKARRRSSPGTSFGPIT